MELHLHSSPAVLRRIFQVLSCLPRIRAAERGEFTKRAYLAGRLSLLQVEGLKDLIDADTEMQRQVAMRSFTVCVNLSATLFQIDLILGCDGFENGRIADGCR